MSHKIAFFELEDWEEKIVRETFPEDELFFSKDKLTESGLPEEHDFEVISVFVNSRINKAVLDSFPNLKCIVTRSTGYDHIDLAAAASWCFVVARQKPQPRCLQTRQRQIFSY